MRYTKNIRIGKKSIKKESEGLGMITDIKDFEKKCVVRVISVNSDDVYGSDVVSGITEGVYDISEFKLLLDDFAETSNTSFSIMYDDSLDGYLAEAVNLLDEEVQDEVDLSILFVVEVRDSEIIEDYFK